jgi:hypothetical protein
MIWIALVEAGGPSGMGGAASWGWLEASTWSFVAALGPAQPATIDSNRSVRTAWKVDRAIVQVTIKTRDGAARTGEVG